ncbi:Aste57867_15423 [Aphanomyces stellatus]|uniref:protein-tyrosine-phosphatase n=1 Tax=Aphanomyces stellatus TaxID=120398 RepID=A0A485L4F4_9STRA|nr:hypothetical protein As57867_015367 [Aphanomyces stellatus]VFT92225.1 Aste57867_15423 [Aphanomyces stellatus]
MHSSTDLAGGSRLTQFQHVSPQWLFNRMQAADDGGRLTLIDTRGFKCYEHSHIWSFVNLPQPLTSPAGSPFESVNMTALVHPDDVVAPMNDAAKRVWSKRRLTDIVLYDHFGMYPQASWAFQLAVVLLHEGAATSVKLLRGGMQAFQRDYPFMIASRKDQQTRLSTAHDRPSPHALTSSMALVYPNDVVPGFLFLGTTHQATQPEILRKMGITHVLSVSDAPSALALPRITYMHVPTTRRLGDAFDPCYVFLKKARKAGGKVLVHCATGVSAAPTLAVLYVMRADKISLVDAYNDVLACRPAMHPTEPCMHMLVEAELYRFGVASVQSLDEMHALQRGDLHEAAPSGAPPPKLATQLSMLFRGRCNDQFVQTNMQHFFGDAAGVR